TLAARREERRGFGRRLPGRDSWAPGGAGSRRSGIWSQWAGEYAGAIMATGPLIVVVGPTASGKTALAIELAERFNGEIICADSRTVYRGLDIGTAKPTAAERSRVRHHLLDVVTPDESFTAADFKRLANEVI